MSTATIIIAFIVLTVILALILAPLKHMGDVPPDDGTWDCSICGCANNAEDLICSECMEDKLRWKIQ